MMFLHFMGQEIVNAKIRHLARHHFVVPERKAFVDKELFLHTIVYQILVTHAVPNMNVIGMVRIIIVRL